MDFQTSSKCNNKEILVIDNVSKIFENKCIIKEISLNVPTSSIYSIIGPNGAGKTTLLRLILGLYKLEKGSIHFGVDKDNICALLENDYLIEAKTGQENIECFCDYFKIDINLALNKIKEYSKILDLDAHLEYKLKIYSKGMKRKLSILITLLRNSELILFDEPTSGIDPKSRIQIRKLFSLLKNENKTIILTSHDLAEVEKVSDIISIIDKGTIIKTFKNTKDIGTLEKEFFDTLGEDY